MSQDGFADLIIRSGQLDVLVRSVGQVSYEELTEAQVRRVIAGTTQDPQTLSSGLQNPSVEMPDDRLNLLDELVGPVLLHAALQDAGLLTYSSRSRLADYLSAGSKPRSATT